MRPPGDCGVPLARLRWVLGREPRDVAGSLRDSSGPPGPLCRHIANSEGMGGRQHVCGELPERQDPGARPARPVERYDGALREVFFAIGKGFEQCLTAEFGHERLAAQKDYAGARVARMGKDLWKIEVVGQKYVSMLACVLADVRFFKVRKIAEQLLDRAPSSKSFHNHPHRYAHAPNTGLPAHDLRIHGYAPKFLHAAIITHLAEAGRAMSQTFMGSYDAVVAGFAGGKVWVLRDHRSRKQEK